MQSNSVVSSIREQRWRWVGQVQLGSAQGCQMFYDSRSLINMVFHHEMMLMMISTSIQSSCMHELSDSIGSQYHAQLWCNFSPCQSGMWWNLIFQFNFPLFYWKISSKKKVNIWKFEGYNIHCLDRASIWKLGGSWPKSDIFVIDQLYKTPFNISGFGVLLELIPFLHSEKL